MSMWLAVIFYVSIVDGTLAERRHVHLDKESCERHVEMMTKATEWSEAGVGGCIHLRATPAIDAPARIRALKEFGLIPSN